MPLLALLKAPKMLMVLAAFLAGVASATWTTLKIKNGEIAKIELAHAEARHQAFMEGRARQMKSDAATRDIETEFHVSNVKIIRRTQTIVEEVPIYVQDNATCVTVGLVRVLDAAALGTDPAALDLASGESNETCAGIGSHALAKSVSENYGRFHETADQLTKLQGWVDDQIAINNAKAPP